VATEIGGLEDGLEALDGKRQAKLPEQADFRGAMDQIGEQDISFAILTGPLQKSIAGEGAGMLALLQPVLQPLFGDVQAWTVGISLDTPRGQAEMTAGIFVPGEKVGLWSLLGTETAIEAPPPMIGPDAIGFGRVNVRFKDLMPLINTVVANLPEEQAAEIDGFLVNFGPVLGKAFEALGPGVWTYETIRQPITPESRVTGTIVTCTNPKAVVPMITQFGGTMGLEPRDVLLERGAARGGRRQQQGRARGAQPHRMHDHERQGQRRRQRCRGADPSPRHASWHMLQESTKIEKSSWLPWQNGLEAGA
jgi:hypothetical protein